MSDFVHSLIIKGNPLQNKSMQICSRVGINLLSDEKVKLEQLIEATREAIKFNSPTEVLGVEDRDLTSVLLALQLIKASIDAFFQFYLAIAENVPVLKGTTWVGHTYFTTQTVVGVATEAAAGRLDGRGAIGLLEKGADKVWEKKVTKESEKAGYALAQKLLFIKARMLTSALQSDYKQLMKDCKELLFEVRKEIGKLLVISGRKDGYLSKENARTLASVFKLLGFIKAMIEAWIDYSAALEKAFDEKISNDEFMMERDQKLKALQGKLLEQERHLADVVRQLNECYGALDDELVEQLVCKAAG